jgi:membrane protein
VRFLRHGDLRKAVGAANHEGTADIFYAACDAGDEWFQRCHDASGPHVRRVVGTHNRPVERHIKRLRCKWEYHWPTTIVPGGVMRLILAFREAGMRFSRDGCAFLSQAIAFNALFAIFPLLVLVLTAASFVIPHADRQILSFFDTFAPALHDTVAENLRTYVYGRGLSSIIAFIVVIWASKNLFMGLAYALNRALAVPKSRPLYHDLLISIIMLPTTGIVMLFAIGMPVVVSIVFAKAHVQDPRNLSEALAYLLSMALVFVVVIFLYTFLPNRSVHWQFAVPGASFVALMWPAVQYIFAFYTVHVDFTRIYGALSAPLVLLLWFYLIGIIFFFGAELSAGWAHHKGSEEVSPLVDPVRPTEHTIAETEGAAGS